MIEGVNKVDIRDDCIGYLSNDYFIIIWIVTVKVKLIVLSMVLYIKCVKCGRQTTAFPCIFRSLKINYLLKY